MKRVALLTNVIPPYRVSLYRKLAHLDGIDLRVLHGAEHEETGRSSVSSDLRLPFATIPVMNSERRIGPFTIRWQRGAFKSIRAFTPDVVILLGISGTLTNWIIALWARLRNIRVIMWTCGWEAQKKNSPAYWLKRLLMSIYYLMPHHMLVYSTKARDYMEEIGVPRSRVSVCYNGLETDHLAHGEEKTLRDAEEFRLSQGVGDKTVFLFVGGMLKEKRVDLLLQAFAKLKRPADTLLWLVGDGPQIGIFRRTASELGFSNVKFFGRIFDGVDTYFAAADFFVLPGLGGLALNQAMMWGVPCICSEADGTEEDLIIDGVTGFRFEPGDVSSLTHTMLKAMRLRRSETHLDMGRKAREIILRRSNVDRMVSEFQSAIRSRLRV
jgi:glycosyltransferase involved in cell wall biosynthesis